CATLLSLPPFPTRRSSDLIRGGIVHLVVVEHRRSGLAAEGMDLPVEHRRGEPSAPARHGRFPGPAIRGGVIGLDHVVVLVGVERDRKSTRLNSSHLGISYA